MTLDSLPDSFTFYTMSTKYDVKDFRKEVIEASHETPVVADFWADWCAPCKVLGPVLEELAGESNGKWKLAKVNTEEMPNVASEYGIQGIPAVKMFVDGEPVDEFVGALPKYQVELWLQQALPSRFRRDVQAAEYLEAEGKGAEAAQVLARVVQEEPDNVEARLRLGKLILFTDPDRAEELLDGLEEPLHSDQIEAIRTISRLHKLKRNPDSLPSGEGRETYKRGIEALAKRDFESALMEFIGTLKAERYYDDDGPRKACIAIFKFLGEEHGTTQKYRREFSSALYV